MRADAVRRRETLVHEARRIFARHGAGVALESVADAAGVGIATLYRNFASRQALLDAVALAALEDVLVGTEQARVNLVSEHGDPWDVWSTWADEMAAMELGALAAAFAGEYGSGFSEEVAERQRALELSLGGLLESVRGLGFVGSDLTPLELVVGIGRITRPHTSASVMMADDLGLRLVRMLLLGLRESARA